MLEPLSLSRVELVEEVRDILFLEDGRLVADKVLDLRDAVQAIGAALARRRLVPGDVQ